MSQNLMDIEKSFIKSVLKGPKQFLTQGVTRSYHPINFRCYTVLDNDTEEQVDLLITVKYACCRVGTASILVLLQLLINVFFVKKKN